MAAFEIGAARHVYISYSACAAAVPKWCSLGRKVLWKTPYQSSGSQFLKYFAPKKGNKPRL